MVIPGTSERILEQLATSIAQVESQVKSLNNENERTKLEALIRAIKNNIGEFFSAHIDRRSASRGTDPVHDYQRYFFGLPRQARASLNPLRSCRFCESKEVKFRRRDADGTEHWYCMTCHQEISC